VAKLYLVGSLRNELIQEYACLLREDGHDVFDDWHGAGPKADDCWRDYEKYRGRPYIEALRGKAPQMIMNFDRSNILASDTVIMVLPAGKSGHLELGLAIGAGKRTHILLDKDYDRWDVMYAMANEVHDSFEYLRLSLKATSLVNEFVDQICEEAGL
jgi:hypothetical protein